MKGRKYKKSFKRNCFIRFYKFLGILEILLCIIWIFIIVKDCINDIYNWFDILFVSVAFLHSILKYIRW